MTVAVFDADSPPALAFVRSLGRSGVEVNVYATGKWAVASASRYTSRNFICPDPENMALFLPWLRGRVESGEIELIAPTSDLMAYYIAELSDILPQGHGAPARSAVQHCLFKERFHNACVAAGQATPWLSAPRTTEDAWSQAQDYPYPVIIKPRSHVGVGLARGIVVNNAEEFRQYFGPYSIPECSAQVMDEFPELRWPVVQECIPGALQQLFAVSGILDKDGTAVACSACRKIEQWPPTLGIGTLFESWDDPDLLAQGARLASKLVGRGLFELEFIFDSRTGKYLAIDLNPRAYGQIALNIARGHDLPWLWYRLMTKQSLAPQPPAAPEVRWQHAIPFHISTWTRLARGPHRKSIMSRYLKALRGERVDVVNDLDDPMPSVVFTAKMLRHPGGLVRPYLEERHGGDTRSERSFKSARVSQ